MKTKNLKNKDYGETLDAWLDQEYPEMNLIREMNKIKGDKNND